MSEHVNVRLPPISDERNQQASAAYELFIQAMSVAAPGLNVHGVGFDRFWGDRLVGNRIMIYMDIPADELSAVKWSRILAPLQQNGCSDFHVSQSLYDGKNVWAGYDLAGESQERAGLMLEAEELPPSALPVLRRFIHVGMTLPAIQ